MNVVKYSSGRFNTAMHTDITEGGSLVLTILKAQNVNIDEIKTPKDLSDAIRNLPETTQSIDRLRNFSFKLDSIETDLFDISVSKINDAKFISKILYENLKNEGFTDENIISNLRWMGTEDTKATAGDIGLNDFEISIKSNSTGLNNTGAIEGSSRMGLNKSVFEIDDVVNIEEKLLSLVRERLFSEISKSGILQKRVNNNSREWSFSDSDENYQRECVLYKKKGKKIFIPRENFFSLASWKELSSEQQKALSAFVTAYTQELKENNEYNNLMKERADVISKSLSEGFLSLNENEQKRTISKFLSFREGKKCLYVSLSSKKVKTFRIPSVEEFIDNENIKIDSSVPSFDGAIIVFVNCDSYSSIFVRGRYRDGQFNYRGAGVTSEYHKTPSSLRKASMETVNRLNNAGFIFSPALNNLK